MSLILCFLIYASRTQSADSVAHLTRLCLASLAPSAIPASGPIGLSPFRRGRA